MTAHPRIAIGDHPRRIVMPSTMTQLFLRFDAAAGLPHVVETGTGAEVARFRLIGDVAMFVGSNADRQTLPEEYVLQLTKAEERVAAPPESGTEHAPAHVNALPRAHAERSSA